MLQDMLFALRSLRRTPAFWLGIVTTLGVALAATILVFTLLNSYLLRPLPYDETERLAVVYEYSIKGGRDNSTRVTFGNAVDLAERATAFSRVAILRNESVTVHGPEGNEVTFVQRVSPDLFSLIDARAAHGRVFTAADAEAGGQRAVVLSDSLWRRRFGANPAVVGQSVQLDQSSYRIAGVLPSDFKIPTADDNPQAWLAMPPADYMRNERGQRRHHIIAELVPGRSLASAQSELDQLAAALRSEHPAANADRAFTIKSLRDDLLGGYGSLLMLLQAAVLLVLGVACLNCLCLLVARGLQRRREIAVRLALGANRRHLFVQLLCEGLGLALPAAALALALVFLGLPALAAQLPPVVSLQAMGAPEIDFAVIAAVVSVALLVAAVFGVVPLAQNWRMNIESVLRDGGRQLGSVGGARATRCLLVGQVAFCLALVICALLLLQSQRELGRVNPGIAIDELDQFRIGLRGDTYRDPVKRQQFYENVLEELRKLPGVTEASTMSFLAVQPPTFYIGFTQEGDGIELADTPKRAAVRAVLPDLFSVAGIRLLEGRLLNEDDTAEKPPVTVISASLARKYWPDGNVLGRRIQIEGTPGQWFEVVGIVSDTLGIGNQPQAIDSFFVAIPQRPPPGLGISMIMRMSGPKHTSDTLQKAVWRVDPDMQFFSHTSIRRLYDDNAWESRYLLMLVGAFAGLALMLALGGIYAVNSFRVAQRVPEFGVRMALGASASAVRRQVLWENLRLAGAGIALGLVLAALAGFGVRSFLYSTAPLDPIAYVAGVAAMAAACSIAALGPAGRAARVDPIIALRND